MKIFLFVRRSVCHTLTMKRKEGFLFWHYGPETVTGRASRNDICREYCHTNPNLNCTSVRLRLQQYVVIVIIIITLFAHETYIWQDNSLLRTCIRAGLAKPNESSYSSSHSQYYSTDITQLGENQHKSKNTVKVYRTQNSNTDQIQNKMNSILVHYKNTNSYVLIPANNK